MSTLLADVSPSDDLASLDGRFRAARDAAHALALAATERKDAALRAIAEGLRRRTADILAANQSDLERGRNMLAAGLLDRLMLNEARIGALASSLDDIVGLADPVGEVVGGRTLPNGLQISQVRVPLGVVGAIYEARPNVTVDIAALALKSGNAAVLRGGSAAEHTNLVLVDILREALASVGLPGDAVQTVDDYGRPGAARLMRAREWVDVLIPRGSAALIAAVIAESTVPVIETGAGVVHVFLDASAPVEWATEITYNAKVQRPSVCNALETLLVHRDAVERLLPPVLDRLTVSGVIVRGDDRVRAAYPAALPVRDEDWATEYLSLELSVGVVDSLDDAVTHIRKYSTKHTESIVTRDLVNAERFLAEVDAAVVMVNASTRFTDGAEFGFGAEVGISTQKLHARGPMGLPQLTSTKWLVRGAGHVRG